MVEFITVFELNLFNKMNKKFILFKKFFSHEFSTSFSN